MSNAAPHSTPTRFEKLVAELRTAEEEDIAAKLEALHQGMVATQPLTAVRLGELCALGEKMFQAGIRRKAALKRMRQGDA